MSAIDRRMLISDRDFASALEEFLILTRPMLDMPRMERTQQLRAAWLAAAQGAVRCLTAGAPSAALTVADQARALHADAVRLARAAGLTAADLMAGYDDVAEREPRPADARERRAVMAAAAVAIRGRLLGLEAASLVQPAAEA